MTEEETAAAPEEEAPQTARFTFVDGAVYEGGWEEIDGRRVRSGKGVLDFGPERYEGEWSGDEMHGQGCYEFATGATYVGGFARGRFEGQGTYTWSDGAEYTGSWRAGRMHGEGAYVDKDGVRWEGQFFNGKLAQGKTYLTLRSAEPQAATPTSP